ncbi:MAG: hypothetical protein D6800_02000 [Candidatus Zixiibacteriota bacterium]|nr:MAG: hypothetical protein D6800_02000 [candidate division Zixibacteria bacterium]
MYLTLSKRFEFCASRRLYLRDRNEGQNLAAYGPMASPPHGVGDNFEVHFVFHGPVDENTGMMVAFADIKQRLGSIIGEKYDHKFLNIDNPDFVIQPPTVELLAKALLTDAQRAFADHPAQPVACHLVEDPDSSATAFADGTVERHIWLSFSAARRTYSPRLSDLENKRLFGPAANPAGHGHNYRLRVTMTGEPHPAYGTIVPYKQLIKVPPIIRKRLDHRHINKEVPELKKQPVTSETISQYIYERLRKVLPITRLKLYELPWFFVEYFGDNRGMVGVRASFRAAHRLHSHKLSEEQNREVYGKCNNLNGHGHRYDVEASISGTIDERTGIIFDLVAIQEGIEEALAAYDYKHLDLEADDFVDRPSTGENIVTALWPRMDAGLRNRLVRLRLWETPNNRFTLRKEAPADKE